jgi:hypothetical protein
METSSDFLKLLENPVYPEPIGSTADFKQQVAEAKRLAAEAGDEVEATLLWQCETIALVQSQFVAAFTDLKQGKYYEAWCIFERCEIDLSNLLEHYSIEESDLHWIGYIQEMTARWQKIFPYKVFFSPEIVKNKIVCSVCGSRVTPRQRCVHRKGQVYGGSMCYHIVEDAEFLSISIVDKPVQKYSVALHAEENGQKRELYRYSEVKFVVDRLESPFHGWASCMTTRLAVRAEVSHLSSSDTCPCVSGKKFGECCWEKETLTVPHLHIDFAVPPRPDLPLFQSGF